MRTGFNSLSATDHDRWLHEGRPTDAEKIPVEADVPELLIKMGYGKSGSIQSQAVVDLALIVFNYLLRIGKYTLCHCTSLRELIHGRFRLVDAPPATITVPPSETFFPLWSPSCG
jgi:hypothetical protein